MNDGNLKTFLRSDDLSTPSGRIIRVLSERGSLSSAEIARASGLARSTVSTAVAELRKSGLIIEAETESDDASQIRSVGRPGTTLTLNPEAGTCVGVHLGLDALRVAIADVSHSVIAEQTISVPYDYSPALAAGALRDWISDTYAENGLRLSGLLGVGVSVSAPVMPDGTVLRSSIVPTWAGVNVGQAFGKTLGATVLVENESNCSAVAELMWGAARGHDTFVLFKLDLGVGGAIVIGGQVITGIAGGGGEFGHISLDPEGELCRCGNRGCLELKASFLAPLRELSRVYGRTISIDEAVHLAQKGEAGPLRMLVDTADYAGRGLAIVGNVLNPPLVLIGGALARAGSILLDPLRASFERHSLLKSRDLSGDFRTRIATSRFIGNDVVLGAVGLVLRHHGRQV